jgi:hypothetical protein
MKKVLFALSLQALLALVAFSVQMNLPTYKLEGSLAEEVPFIAHDGPRALGSYLSRNVVFAPIERLKSGIERDLKLNLISRGEAHITVIDPLEYQRIKSKIDISEINQIYGQAVQDTHFTVSCLGKGEKEIEGNIEQTFFLVVRSSEILEIRRQISGIHLARGGSSEDFDPELYFPHVTIGFTKRDLHLAADGVKKDLSSCIANIDTE